MIQIFCQWLLVAMVLLGFLGNVHQDFHGREARPAFGYRGFIISLVVCVTGAAVLYGAGAFSRICP